MEVKVEMSRSSEEMMWEEPLSPNAIVYVRTLSAHILVIIGFNSPINLDAFRAQLPLALNHPRFSCIVVGDVNKNEKLKWVQSPHVCIDDHMIVASINPCLRNNSLAGDKFVEEYLHNLTKTSIETSLKPPWEVHLLDLKTSEAESLCIFRIHHALGDGISITSHLLSWARQVSNPNSLPTIAAIKKKNQKKIDIHNKIGVWKLSQRFIFAAWWWLQVLWNTIIDVSMFIATIFFLKDSSMLIMESSEIDTKRRRIVYKTLSLDDMKFIKNAMGVTINDVAIGIITAGFARHLNRRFSNDNKKEDINESMILDKIRMKIALPVNLRSFKGIEGIDDIKKKNSNLGMGNQVGVVLIPLSIRLRDDPLDYVRQAKTNIDRRKRSLGAKANLNFCKFAAKLFGFQIVGSMTVKVINHVSICISNVPGPVEEISLFGHPVKFIAPTVYGPPIPILIHLQSCVNSMSIALSVREDVIIDPHELLDEFIESLLLIKAAVT